MTGVELALLESRPERPYDDESPGTVLVPGGAPIAVGDREIRRVVEGRPRTVGRATVTTRTAEGLGALVADAFYADSNTDLPTLARLLDDCRSLRAGLRACETELELLIDDALGDRKQATAGKSLVEARRRRKGVKWDGEPLVRKVVAYALDERTCDPETGEYERDVDAVVRVLSECSAITNPSHGWRTTPLKARGIDIDEFCEFQGWATSIILTPRDGS